MALGIPKDQIRYIVGKLHVGESDEKVRALIRMRTAPHPGWTQARVKQAEAYALKVHRDNQKMYAYVMGGSAGWRAGMKRRRNPYTTPKSMPGSILDHIRVGDRVTIVNRFGQQHTGRAVMRGPHGWVLNMGGRHGTPAVANNGNIVKVTRRGGG